MRVNVYLPDELHARLRDELPDLNMSALVQRAVRDALDQSGRDYSDLPDYQFVMAGES